MSLLLLLNSQWAPSALPDLIGWLRGDDLSATPVTSWPDRSGSANDAGSLGLDPDLAPANLDGKNVVEFTSANPDVLTWLNVSSLTEGAVFVLAKAKSNNPMSLPVGRMGTAGAFEQYNFGAASSGIVQSEFLSTVAQTTGATFGDAAQWHILGMTSKASDWRLRKNGIELYSTATNTVAGFSGASLIGRDDVASPYFNGYIAEIVFTDAVPTTADQQRIEGYLAWKWGLTSVLDAGHPYKSAPPLPVTIYTLTGQLATFAITGQSANLRANRLLTASAGSIALTGQSANLKKVYRLTANAASFALSGQTAAIRANHLLTLNAASFSLTGQTASLRHAYRLSANAASFALTGQSATLLASRRLILNVGTFTLAGQSASLRHGYNLTAGAGTFAISGQTATLSRLAAFYTLTGLTASFSLTGQSAVLRHQYALSLNPGTFALSGQSASVRKLSRLLASAGVFTVTGLDARLISDAGSGPRVRVTAAFIRA